MESQRIHSLDAMRAILMLLGVYFHLSLAYVTFGDGSEGWVKDPNSTSPIFDLLFNVLHYFRMHGFFMIAGFFGSLLYHKRGAKKMMSNRFKRIRQNTQKDSALFILRSIEKRLSTVEKYRT